METTAYFREQVLRKRPYLSVELCARIVRNPQRSETQEDGRVRYWGKDSEIGDKVLRVITLSDGTLHNAFFDRRFQLEMDV